MYVTRNALQFAGRAVIVIHRGQLIVEKYAKGFDRDTPQLGWSMNKSVVHALVGTQVLAGRLSLEQTSLFPEWTDERSIE